MEREEPEMHSFLIIQINYTKVNTDAETVALGLKQEKNIAIKSYTNCHNYTWKLLELTNMKILCRKNYVLLETGRRGCYTFV